MDRDKRWDRVKIAVDGLVQGTGDKVDGEKDLIKTIEKGYEGDITDEFIKPIICGSEGSRIQSESNTGIKLASLRDRGRHSLHV
jgi:2,3-bisphosphoglycerate-independent phosphoglycerate mutase